MKMEAHNEQLYTAHASITLAPSVRLTMLP